MLCSQSQLSHTASIMLRSRLLQGQSMFDKIHAPLAESLHHNLQVSVDNHCCASLLISFVYIDDTVQFLPFALRLFLLRLGEQLKGQM